MRRMIGFLMMVGLMVGVVGCGDDDNPVKSNQANQDLLVGTWLDEDGDGAGPEVLLADITSPITFRPNGTFVDSDGDEGTWSLVGDQLTLTYDDPGFAAFGFTGTLNSVTDTKLTVTDEDGERDVLTRQT